MHLGRYWLQNFIQKNLNKHLPNHYFNPPKVVGLTGQQFDICYVIQTKVRLEIAEITVFLNFISSYSFALKNSLLKILEDSLEYAYSAVICLLNF